MEDGKGKANNGQHFAEGQIAEDDKKLTKKIENKLSFQEKSSLSRRIK